MAPSQQTHVPYLVWLGQSAASGIEGDCLAVAADEAQSHDNLFHTVLGLMDVSTTIYDPRLDSLSRCRAASGQLAYSPESATGADPAR